KINRMHQDARPNDPQLEARIQSFELAYRMQSEAAEAFDTSKEPKHVLDAYGPGEQARSLLLARRLVERGVRFVQVSHGPVQPWDSHDDLEINHRKLAGQVDRAIAALISDLKRLGLFESTLIIWGGEFGRTPVVEMPTPGSNAGKINGRDHNHWGFTVWLAGGGVKGGQAGGPSAPHERARAVGTGSARAHAGPFARAVPRLPRMAATKSAAVRMAQSNSV